MAPDQRRRTKTPDRRSHTHPNMFPASGYASYNSHNSSSSVPPLPPTQTPPRRPGSLLDLKTIHIIAQKLFVVRQRLSLHSGGNIPSPIELGIALRLYIERCDADRARKEQLRHQRRQRYPDQPHSRPQDPRRSHSFEETSSPPLIPSDAPPPRTLGRLLAISEAAYTVFDHNLLIRSLLKLGLPEPLATKPQAQMWAPGYILVHDIVNHALILSVRGSREAGDLLTNLSSDCEPFLGGFAHQGVVRSAHFLHESLRSILASELSRRRPRHGLVLVGHSLGAAAASALTMILRQSRPPRGESSWATARLTSARCYAFSPPPFLDRKLSHYSRSLPIVSIAYGLDVVPRLSAASVDRLLHKLAAYDFSPHVSSAVSRLVRSVTMPVLGTRDATALGRRAASLRVDANLLAGVSGTVAEVAGRVLEARSSTSARDASRSSGAISGGPPPNRMWGTALTAVLAATRMIGEGVESNASRFAERRQSASNSAGFSGQFGLSADDVDRLLDDGLTEMYLAGDVWHVDKQFVLPSSNSSRNDSARTDWPVPSLVRRDATYFSDIEASVWMISDHEPRFLGKDINRMMSSYSRKSRRSHNTPPR